MLMYLCGIILIEKINFGWGGYYILTLLVWLNLFWLIDWSEDLFTDLVGFKLDLYQEFTGVLNFLSYSFNLYTVYFVVYLFISLIIVYEIVKKCAGPLRIKS